MSLKDPKIMFFGAGAIGGSVAAWVAEHYDNVIVLDQNTVIEAIRSKGITTYCVNTPDDRTTVRVRTTASLDDARDADIIAVCVKNYSLDAVSKSIRAAVGDRPFIIGMQNGIENQRVLPRYFSKVIYCAIGYNAWLDETGVVGYQKKGPLVFGTLDNSLRDELTSIASLFNRGVETVVTDHFQDASHSKLIINLTNSLTTLVGHKVQEISDPALFQKLLTNLLLEGVQIARTAGYHECKIGGMPPWRKIWMGARLPRFMTRRMFDANAKKMVMSSMAQDIIQRSGHESELETINGYFISLADRHNMAVPYNRAVYELCRQEFSRPVFQPMDVAEVWEKVREKVI